MRVFCIILATILTNNAITQSADSLLVHPANPINVNDTSVKELLMTHAESFVNTGNKLFSQHPSALFFPGIPDEGYKKLATTFYLIHNQATKKDSVIASKYLFAYPQALTQYSTGFYAPPGEKVEIELPDSWQGEDIWISIGSHSDHLFYTKEDWRRMPVVISQIRLTKELKFISSPFGGLISFLVHPSHKSLKAPIKLNGVITAPYYKLGSTTAIEWTQQIKENKAPWGEIASDKVIIALPDSALKKISDPVQVLKQWNKILETEYELSQLPSPFIRPIRIVVDEHMAVGAMHSGYPIMIHHSPTQQMLSLDILTDPIKLLLGSDGGANWGFFHEIGHNLQNFEWVFDGTTEVGCNLYSLYVFDKLIGNRNGAHVCIAPAYQDSLMRDYFIKGAKYDDFQKEPFLGLIPFMQLQKKFGWSAFKQVFRSYINNPDNSLSKTDVDQDTWKKINLGKINVFVKRFSETTETNLAPFFLTWGIPVSATTNQNLSKYPEWMPEELSKYLKLKN